MTYNIPVLFLIFNRFDTTKIVFENIKKQQPAKLYIASDGPRPTKDMEAKLVAEIREYVISQIDWECEVKTLFRTINLGCKRAVSSAITWFFENEEMGVILEDDCLPSQTFFPFCEELLIKYKDDTRVWHIDGTTSQAGMEGTSYQFSKYCLIWGWATWRRAWIKYDPDIRDFPNFKKCKLIESVWQKPEVRKFWIENFEKAYHNQVDTWDYQWAYTVWKNNGLSIRPGVNLIKNIGFNMEATHTHSASKLLVELKNQEIEFPLIPPLFMIPDERLDDICSASHFEIHKYHINLMKRIKLKIKTIFHNGIVR
jgi:hypothetical protein